MSNNEIRFNRILEIANVLYNLKYPKLLIQDAMCKSCNNSQTNTVTSITNNLLPFVIKYNKTNTQVAQSVKNNFLVLQNNSLTQSIFENIKLQVSYINNNNIIRALNKPVEQVRKCFIKRCGTCPLLITGSKLELDNGTLITPNKTINCRSKNLIYLIICGNCNLYYIGETENELRFRVTLHKQHCTSNYGFLKVNIHIKNCIVNNEKLFKIFPFYQNNLMSKKSRKELEDFFIKLYKPPLNS